MLRKYQRIYPKISLVFLYLIITVHVLIVDLLCSPVYEWSKHTVHLLVEVLEHNHGSLNIPQTYKAALILSRYMQLYIDDIQ